MTDTELLEGCARAINSGANPPLIILVIKGHRKTFAGKGSPRGQVLEERKDENVIAFNAIDILAYMKAKGRLSFQPLPSIEPTLCTCPVPGFWPSKPDACPTCGRAHRERKTRSKA